MCTEGTWCFLSSRRAPTIRVPGGGSRTLPWAETRPRSRVNQVVWEGWLGSLLPSRVLAGTLGGQQILAGIRCSFRRTLNASGTGQPCIGCCPAGARAAPPTTRLSPAETAVGALVSSVHPQLCLLAVTQPGPKNLGPSWHMVALCHSGHSLRCPWPESFQKAKVSVPSPSVRVCGFDHLAGDFVMLCLRASDSFLCVMTSEAGLGGAFVTLDIRAHGHVPVPSLTLGPSDQVSSLAPFTAE